MNKNLTEIAYILDRSASMGSITNTTIESCNDFILEQKTSPGEARFSLILFDTEYEEVLMSQPIEEVMPIDDETYSTRGCTSLLDAIGKTVTNIGNRLAVTPEQERPGKVIIVIYTDGHENSSSEFNVEQIRKLVTQQQDVYSWDFLFMAAHRDALEVATSMGIKSQTAVGVHTGAYGQARATRTASKVVSTYREYARQDYDSGVAYMAKACLIDAYNSDEDL